MAKGKSKGERLELEQAEKGRRGHLNLAIKRIDSLKGLVSLESPDILTLTAHVASLRECKRKLEECDTIIQSNLEPVAYGIDIEMVDERNIEIATALLKAEKVIQDQDTRDDNTSTRSHPGGYETNLLSIPSTSQNISTFRLPLHKLPQFYGDIEDFPEYWEEFSASIDKQPFEDVVKMKYLLDTVHGDVKKLISGLGLRENSYTQAKTILMDKFQNKPKLIQKLLLELKDLRSPKYDYTELFNFQSEMTCLLETLKNQNIGIDCPSCDVILGTFLFSKLPDKIKGKVNYENPKESWTIPVLKTTLDRTIASMQADGAKLKAMKDAQPRYEPKQKSDSFYRFKGNPRRTSTVLHASQTTHKSQYQQTPTPFTNHPARRWQGSTGNSPSQTSKICSYCRGAHRATRCDVYPNIEDRKSIIRQRNLCYNCLGGDHVLIHCISQIRCFSCGQSHHTSICTNTTPQSTTIPVNNNPTSIDRVVSSTTSIQPSTSGQPPMKRFKPNNRVNFRPPPPSFNRSHPNTRGGMNTNVSITTVQDTVLYPRNTTSVLHPERDSGVALPLASLNIQQGEVWTEIKTLFDMASQTTLLDRMAAEYLELTPHRKKRLTIQGINTRGETKTYDVVSVPIVTDKGTISINAVVVDSLPSELHTPGLTTTTRMLLDHGVQLANPEASDVERKIQLLIGSDNLPKFLKSFNKIQDINILETIVGNLIWGPIPHSAEDSTTCVNHITVLRTATTNSQDNFPQNLHSHTSPSSHPIKNHNEEHGDIDRLWRLDQLGIQHEDHTETERNVLEKFKQDLRLEEGRYTVSLPWKSNHKPLPDNYSLAKSRLYSVLKRMRSDPELLRQYDLIFKDQVERGFIEEIYPRTPIHPEAKIHYLPHHGVKKESSTTALRVVYDCSSNNPSLNDCLYSGPSLITDLGKLLLRFRTRNYAVVADIEKAFLCLRLAERDRDSTRFLWVRDPLDTKSTIMTYRFKSVLFGSTASPFLLAACLQEHIMSSELTYKDTMMDYIYVDNVLHTSDTEESIIDFFSQVRALFSKAGLNLREWISNSKLANNQFHKLDLGVSDRTVKVLGMLWDTSSDSITYPVREVETSANTKRTILSNIASVFDPLGILSPVLIRGKILLQELWQAKYHWDQPINNDLQEKWKTIAKQINKCFQLHIPRQLLLSDNVDLHAFSDASKVAYATAVYAVTRSGENKVAHLLIAKSRVSPINKLSIPRLELMGTLLSSRLLKYVQEAYSKVVKINNLYGWCDSQVCLQWLYSTKQLPVFQQNRVDEIRRNVPNVIWKYIPTKENPADQASRGASSEHILSPLWLKGPQWLTDSENWPDWDQHPLKADPIPSQTLTILRQVEELDTTPLFDIKRYSSLTKIYKITALVLRFLNNLRNKTEETSRTSRYQDQILYHDLSLSELKAAEDYWVTTVQQEVYNAEIKSLRGQNPVTRLIKQLDLRLVKGLIRCNRRLSHAELPYTTKFPLLLPSSHHFTTLLITDSHYTHHHVGVSQLIQIMRERFYMVKLRQQVKKVIRSCVLCRKLQTLRIQPGPLADLPMTRVSETRPFGVVGIDYTGYFQVKIKRSLHKCYIMLVTCATTRAVHLELVLDNSTDSFLRAFRRFINRRGRPTLIYSDRATYFQAAAAFLKSIQEMPSVKDYMTEHHITWRFNPARTPHFGGFFERLIGMTKTCLKRTLQTSLVNWEEFMTVLTEVELTLNTRPLTYVSGDLSEDEPLTPIHLISGHNLSHLPIPEELLDQDETYGTRDLISRRHKHTLHLINKFKKTWKKDYLVQLKQSWNRQGKTHIKLGDIVLIEGIGSRLTWKLGLVTSLHPGTDGVTRAVTLKTQNGETTRGVVHLYPLEVNASHTRVEESDRRSGTSPPPPDPHHTNTPLTPDPYHPNIHPSLDPNHITTIECPSTPRRTIKPPRTNNTSRPSRSANIQAKNKIRAILQEDSNEN